MIAPEKGRLLFLFIWCEATGAKVKSTYHFARLHRCGKKVSFFKKKKLFPSAEQRSCGRGGDYFRDSCKKTNFKRMLKLDNYAERARADQWWAPTKASLRRETRSDGARAHSVGDEEQQKKKNGWRSAVRSARRKGGVQHEDFPGGHPS